MRERREGGTREGVRIAPPRWVISLLLPVAAGVSLAILGAAGSHEMSLGGRMLFWVPLMGVTSLVGVIVSMLVRRRLPASPPSPASLAILTGLIIPPATATVWVYLSIASRYVVGLDISVSEILGPSAVITALMTAAYLGLEQPGAFTSAGPELEQKNPDMPKFFRRFPPGLAGARLFALRSEDHYLRLYTSKGEDLILMRLSDAILELDGVEGAQTHRSWWVAREAVEGHEREGERVFLKGSGGLRIPVSRPNLRPLREAGWI